MLYSMQTSFANFFMSFFSERVSEFRINNFLAKCERIIFRKDVDCKDFRSFAFVLMFAVFLFAFPAPSFSAEVKPDVLNLSIDEGIPLTLSTPASSVFIANPEIADVQVLSPTSVMVFGKKTGQTTLLATDGGGKNLLHKTILVSQNLGDLRAALKTVIPNNKISVDSVPGGIVLTGEAKDPSTVEDARRLAMRYVPKDGGEVINRIKVRGSNQIQIRVRFAEVSRDIDKRFGIDWESIGNIGGFAFGLATGAPVLAREELKAVPNLLNRNRPITGSNTNGVISMSKQGKNYNVNGLIDALAQDGLITVLAEPNLTAMSGETASFLAGGEFPVPVPQSQTTISIEWKEYGVSLAFTPTLIGEDRINLHVRPEVSQLTDVGSVTLNDIVVPALTTRRADTTIELASGQSFAIGGLLNNSQNHSVDKYPFLGDMPILGPLFRSTRFQNSESELVIIITPYIVKPVNEEQLALPTDGFSPPSDTDRILRLRQTNSDPDARTISGTPRAVRIEPEDAPVPEASPVMPVSEEDGELMSKPISEEVIPAPVQHKNVEPKKAVHSKLKSPSASPSGPGGFIME